eukprot:10450929-Alexandrium_andersonii.AAC.1
MPLTRWCAGGASRENSGCGAQPVPPSTPEALVGIWSGRRPRGGSAPLDTFPPAQLMPSARRTYRS